VAVRSDAWPDRTTAGTDGIDSWWSGQQRNRLSRVVGSGQVFQKSATNGAISAMLVRIAYRVDAFQMKIISRAASPRDRYTLGAVFEAKMEIPVDLDQN
jgi:hypothetical protein